MSDFYADKKKYWCWQKDSRSYRYPFGRLSKKEAAEMGYVAVELPRMGHYRFFMCESELLPEKTVTEHAPDHGLLYCSGNRVRMVIAAPRRDSTFTDLDSEVRFLRFAIINGKKPYSGYEIEQAARETTGELFRASEI